VSHQFEGFELPNGDILLRRVSEGGAGCGCLLILFLCFAFVSDWVNRTRTSWSVSAYKSEIGKMNKIVKNPSSLVVYAPYNEDRSEHVVEYVGESLEEFQTWLNAERSIGRFTDGDLASAVRVQAYATDPSSISGWEAWKNNPNEIWTEGWTNKISIIVWWKVEGNHYELNQLSYTPRFSLVKTIPSLGSAKSMLGTRLDFKRLK
jgi:hypothetical protein